MDSIQCSFWESDSSSQLSNKRPPFGRNSDAQNAANGLILSLILVSFDLLAESFVEGGVDVTSDVLPSSSDLLVVVEHVDVVEVDDVDGEF